MTEAGGRGDAAQAPRAAGPSEEEWISACRRAVEVQKRVFTEHQGIEARTQYEGVGEGGDRTLVIDRLCEDAIFDELDRLHDAGHEFTAVSEERGDRHLRGWGVAAPSDHRPDRWFAQRAADHPPGTASASLSPTATRWRT